MSTIEITFTHPRTSDIYLADVNLLITAEQILAELHTENTGPFLQPLAEEQYEVLLFRRANKFIEFKSCIGDAGVINGDVLDVVWTGNKDNSSLEAYVKVSSNDPLLVGKTTREHDAFPKLSDPQQYIEDVKKRIVSYTKHSDHCKLIHDIIQYITIFGAASITVVLAIPGVSHWIPTVISSVIAVATAIDKFNNFIAEHHKYRRCKYLMNIKLRNYLYGLGPFVGKDAFEALKTFEEFIVEIEDELHGIREHGEENKGNLALSGKLNL